ncbi:L-idonate 5-dehydrogenase [Arcanobacterium haemolyticum]|nr:L-idonate 5-dehydrogenase [Arcanobacterium haemolyticum]
MKRLAIHKKEDIRLEEVPKPEPGKGQVRLRVRYVGICGSDIHYYFAGANGEYTVREPFAPGHELSGEVDYDPSGTYAPGTPVTVHPARYGDKTAGIEDRPYLWPNGDYLGSAAPFPHRQGAAAEYLIVEDFMVRPLPEGLPVKSAALAEPLGVALHAINIGEGVKGKKVLVLGAGPIGLLLIAGAKALGAASVAAGDVQEGPLERAKEAGADEVFLIGRDEIPETAYERVFECSGVPVSLENAVRKVARAGIIVQTGMFANRQAPINLAPMLAKEAQVRGTFRFGDEIDDAIAMLAAHPEIASVITHSFPVEKAEDAFATAKDSATSGKVLIEL